MGERWTTLITCFEIFPLLPNTELQVISMRNTIIYSKLKLKLDTALKRFLDISTFNYFFFCG